MSTLEVSNLNDGTTTVATTFITNGSSKAWANIQGSGTAALRVSYNLSSLTDSGTGQYSLSLSSSMGSTNVSSVVTGDFPGGAAATALLGTNDFNNITSSSIRINFVNGSAIGFTDVIQGSFALFGDLA